MLAEQQRALARHHRGHARGRRVAGVGGGRELRVGLRPLLRLIGLHRHAEAPLRLLAAAAQARTGEGDAGRDDRRGTDQHLGTGIDPAGRRAHRHGHRLLHGVLLLRPPKDPARRCAVWKTAGRSAIPLERVRCAAICNRPPTRATRIRVT